MKNDNSSSAITWDDNTTVTDGTTTGTYVYPHYEGTEKTVQDLEEAIKYRKTKVLEDILNHIKYDMDEEMAMDIAKKIIAKFGLDVDQLRVEIITEKL